MSLRTSEAVKTVVEYPHRLGELFRMLGERDRKLRGRAAGTIAKLAETHPECLVSHLRLLTDSANDESAHVRWNVVFALGQICSSFPDQSEFAIAGLITRLKDANTIVGAISGYALAEVARANPDSILRWVSGSEQKIPEWLGGVLQKYIGKASQSENG